MPIYGIRKLGAHLLRHNIHYANSRLRANGCEQTLGFRGADAAPATRCCIVGGLTHRPVVRFGGTLECGIRWRVRDAHDESRRIR